MSTTFEKVTITNRWGTSITAETDDPIIEKALANPEGGYSIYRRWTVTLDADGNAVR